MTQSYSDDDLVHVDPKSRKVLGKVEWDRDGLPKPLPMQNGVGDAEERKRGRKREFYPWGTYRSMKHSFNVEGKRGESEEGRISLDEALKKATEEPFW